MTFKEQLVAEIETMTESQIAEVLIMMKNVNMISAKSPHKKSLNDKIKELQQICIEEDYYLESPSRQDRVNLFF